MVQFGLILDIYINLCGILGMVVLYLRKIDLKNGGILYYGTYKMS